MQPIEIRWSWLATFDRKIQRRQREPTLESLFPRGTRFLVRVELPESKVWFDHGPLIVGRLSKTHLLYWHLKYDTLSSKPRRMARAELRTALRAKRVTFLTSGNTPSTTSPAPPAPAKRG